ncbi:hypothetical protein RHGRI_025328 [Rhododendron griersonianum]|uniref:Uncharacterized protein n=1 Tax=Rhododendron griersonianum TaxID=479676 RepID=A0AAV6IS91_9ERIC|nr:hypothetical protein RHGRI_025328 [Rhododendron griersonianum]
MILCRRTRDGNDDGTVSLGDDYASMETLGEMQMGNEASLVSTQVNWRQLNLQVTLLCLFAPSEP